MFFILINFGDWKDDLVTKIAYCSYRRFEFSSLHQHWPAHKIPIAIVPGGQSPSSGYPSTSSPLPHTYRHGHLHIDIHIHKNKYLKHLSTIYGLPILPSLILIFSLVLGSALVMQ